MSILTEIIWLFVESNVFAVCRWRCLLFIISTTQTHKTSEMGQNILGHTNSKAFQKNTNLLSLLSLLKIKSFIIIIIIFASEYLFFDRSSRNANVSDCLSVCAGQTCLEQSISIFLGQRAITASNQRAIRKHY